MFHTWADRPSPRLTERLPALGEPRAGRGSAVGPGRPHAAPRAWPCDQIDPVLSRAHAVASTASLCQSPHAGPPPSPGVGNQATPATGATSVAFEKTAADGLRGPARDGPPIMHLGRLGGSWVPSHSQVGRSPSSVGICACSRRTGPAGCASPSDPPQLARWPDGGALQ